MDIKVTINYDSKHDFYKLDVRDSEDNVIPFVNCRVYRKESEAALAAGLMKVMFDRVDNWKVFDINNFEFNIRAIFRLIDADCKW